MSFHAHPDDEALLTAGTLARAVRDGHRVVVVVATTGEAGLSAGSPEGLAATRTAELEASVAAIGAHRVEVLGFADSGFSVDDADGSKFPPDPDAQRFSDVHVELAAHRLAAILVEEGADALTGYDPAGGYGHRDHVQVHRVAARAAALAGTPLLLEATIDRRLLLPVHRVLRAIARLVALPALPDLSRAYTAHADLTHRVDVRGHLDAKLASMAAHVSQASADEGVRTLALLLRLPRPVARRVLGTEWFREVGRPGGAPLLDDIFASLRCPDPDGQRTAAASRPRRSGPSTGPVRPRG
ncbi:PIG-L deacetylase family protein [Nocardioides luti]|uniref:PIG-L deacetylase family protein n=1 Tax=Nocardioides luti TaxID=2761101 RepID=UPI0031B57CFB